MLAEASDWRRKALLRLSEKFIYISTTTREIVVNQSRFHFKAIQPLAYTSHFHFSLISMGRIKMRRIMNIQSHSKAVRTRRYPPRQRKWVQFPFSSSAVNCCEFLKWRNGNFFKDLRWAEFSWIFICYVNSFVWCSSFFTLSRLTLSLKNIRKLKQWNLKSFHNLQKLLCFAITHYTPERIWKD